MTKKKHRIIWRLTIVLAVLTVGISFSPIIIPSGVYTPMLFGLPYSLWTTILLTLFLVFLTWVATKVHPEGREAKLKEKTKI